MSSLLVGLIDSGVSAALAPACSESCGFVLNSSGTVAEAEAREDRLGHGTALAEILLAESPDVRLVNAQVFTQRLSCSAAQIAAALDWMVGRNVPLVNMSFGLREDREVLRQACAEAQAAGVVLIASSPARGEPVYPANYPGVIRATGDARCAINEISILDTEQADFGAYVRCRQTGVAGASVGCAHLSAYAARLLTPGSRLSVAELKSSLGEQATYRGAERKLR